MVVFPAYAGVILQELKKDVNFLSVPRVCGGDPTTYSLLGSITQCSPRMRG